MARRFTFRSLSDEEFLALPPHLRAAFGEILPSLVERPFRSGLRYTVDQVRNHPGLWKVRLTGFPPRLFRAIYEVDGDLVRFLGFGPRPGCYRRSQDQNRLSAGRRHSLTELAGTLSPGDAAGIRRVIQEARRAEAISERGPLRSRSRSRERRA
ncbi:MAG: hypothetical protein HKL79_01870 [Thermoplasmata archaeon]|nr:hypothetical protein [Thermoplasmata archaeon]